MKEIGTTRSVCPKCLKAIPAKIFEKDKKVFMEKTCETHGDYLALLSSDSQMYQFAKDLYPNTLKKMVNNCPTDCGLCPSHSQHTCIALIEVTKKCNLHCNVCFASAGEQKDVQVSQDTIKKMFQAVLKSEGGIARPVQLSGGEPLIRKDLPEIVQMGQKLGFKHIEINTNGIALAEEPDLSQRLAEAGVSQILLQFDGVNDDVYFKIRGENLLSYKIDAIENCEKNGIGVTLVPAIIKGINDDQLGPIIRFAMSKKNVTAINFQPVTYIGRYPQTFQNKVEDRATIPDLIQWISDQTNNALTKDDFYPVPCPHPQCTMLTLVLTDGNTMLPLTRLVNVKSLVNSVENPASVVPNAVSKLWSLQPPTEIMSAIQNYIFSADFAKGATPSSKVLTISMMHFQDCWNLDLERLQKCCIHVVTPEGRLVPFCAHYLTSIDGNRLYS